VPWIYGEDAAKSMSKFVEAKHRLMPYLYNLVLFSIFCFPRRLMALQAVQAHSNGHPLQRAMFLEFLDDRTTHTLDRQ
jgi:alpha-glucosidase (family GH31 glycosyl hydrolase)